MGGAGIYEGLVPRPRQLEGGQNLGKKFYRPSAYLGASEGEWYSDLKSIHPLRDDATATLEPTRGLIRASPVDAMAASNATPAQGLYVIFKAVI